MKNWNTKLVNAVNGDEKLEKKVQELLESFSKLSEKEAKSFLIKLLTDIETLAKKLEINSIVLRSAKSTLVSYYKETNPKCWLTEAPIFPNVVNNITDDVTLGFFVYDTICKSIQNGTKEENSRILFLLQSKEEKLFFGGLRALGFSKEISDYLKPKANEVGRLFEEEFEKLNQYITESNSVFVPKTKGDPKNNFRVRENLSLRETMILPENPIAEINVPEYTNSGIIALESESRLKKASLFPNRSMLLNLFDISNKLLKQGIDPCIALQNQEKILTLIGDEFI